MLGIELNRGRGNVKEGLVVNSFDVEQGGHQLWTWRSQSWCGQMDLASAYVLHPMNRLVLDFVAWNRGWVNKRRYTGLERSEGTCRERGKVFWNP